MSQIKKETEELSDGEFHDAEENITNNEKVIEEIFSDALNLDEPETNNNDEKTDEEKIIVRSKEESDKLKQEGNEVFKGGDYEKAIQLYSKALEVCPVENTNDQSILFNNRAAAQKHLGDKEAAIEGCTKAIELNPNYVKALLRRAALFEETEKWNESLGDYQKVVELEPSNAEARGNIQRLTPIVEEYNEKLKQEMMGKLKDLGNMILKPFGLSTNNFQLQQDPGTGSYSVNFKQ